MRQRSLLFCLFLFIGFVSSKAQSIAPNWTATDINGDTHTLSDYTNAGKHVIIDFSATWCGPCWSYHNSGTLETMWDLYGPDGTDEIMIFYLESDYDTNLACITGNTAQCSDFTYGDWTAGVHYPIINLTPSNGGNVWNQYSVPGFPTVSVINAETNQFWNLVGNGASGQGILEDWVFGSFELGLDGTVVDAVCGGDGEVISDAMNGSGNLSYSWSNGAFTEDLMNVDPGSYELTVTDENGFSADASFVVGGNPNGPVGVATSSVTNVDCSGDLTGSISIQAEGGNGNYDYAWSTGAVGPDVSNLPTGDYEVSVTDGIGCSMVEYYTIDEPEAIVLNYSTTNASCGEQNGSVNASAAGGVGLFSYTLAGETNNTGQFGFLQPGIYELYSVDQNFCETITDVEIFDIPAPTAVAAAGATLSCENTSVVVSGFGSSSGGTITYEWTTTDGNIVDGSGSISATVDASGTYTLTVLDFETGCESTSQAIVSGSSLAPVVSIATPPMITCAVQEIQLTGTSTITGGNITYAWTTTDGNIVSGSSTLEPVVDQGGTYTLVATNSENGCMDSEQVSVSADANIPTVSVPNAEITCTTTSLTLCADVSAGATAAWTIDGEVIAANCADVSAAGTYTVTVTAANGCTATAESVVSDMTARPVVAVNSPDMLTCAVSTVMLVGTLEGDPANYSAEWVNENGDVIGMGLTVEATAAGTYALVVTNNATGCSSSEMTTVGQSDDLPVLTLAPAEDLTCLITSVPVSASVNGNSDDHTFAWSNEAGEMISTTATTQVTEPGTYTVSVVSNANGCSSTSSITVEEIREDPVSSYELENTNGTLNLGSTASGNPQSLMWSVNGEEIDASTVGNLTFPENGVYTICLAVTNDCGTDNHCEDYNYAVALTSSDQAVDVQCKDAANGMITVTPTGGEGDYTIAWTGPNGFTSDQLTIMDLVPGEYSMNLNDTYGYSLDASYTIDQPSAIEMGSTVVNEESADGAADGSVSISLFGGTGDYTFLWTNGSTESVLENVPAGDYSVDVTDENGCTSTFGPFTVDLLSTAVEDLSFASSIALYPVPTSDRLFLEMELVRNTAVMISITDAYGRLVSSRNLGVKSTINETLDVSLLDSGIYFLQITDGQEHTTEKFMVIK